MKVFIRNITVIISFLLGFPEIIYAQNSTFTAKQEPIIFLLIPIGLLIYLPVVSSISGIFRKLIRDHRQNRITNASRRALVTSDPQPRTPPTNFIDPPNVQDAYRMWPLRIPFPDSPWNVDGVSNDLVFRLNLTVINNIVRAVISELQNKKQGG